MPLKLIVKPDEQVFIGTTRITVAATDNTTLIIDGTLPVLRGSDYLTLPPVPSPIEELVGILQEVYLTGEFAPREGRYRQAMVDALAASELLRDRFSAIDELVLKREWYKALRSARKLLPQ